MSRHERLDVFSFFRARPCGAKPSACALASLTLIASVQTGHAWAADPTGVNTLPTVTVQTPAARDTQASITGWGNTPGWQAPAQAVKLQAEALEQAQVQRLADVVKLDASTSDAYNTTGYWDYLSVRGFTLDNASNYRREGLPISAETRIPLDNKSGVEIFKGTSGLQAGVSAPGGLINLLVKRPDGRLRQAEVAFTGGSSVKTAVDLSNRFGHEQQFGLRVNAAVERLNPDIQAADGQRRLMALAGQWTLDSQNTLDIELEHSIHRQPSVPGFSAFGPVLPNAKDMDPAININQQAWTLPVDMRGHTGSIKWQHNWDDNWQSVVSYGEQRLKTDDRAAFPFGCDAEGDYTRYCTNGTADVYDYRSEGEYRTTRALQARLTGTHRIGKTNHDLSLGLLRTDHHTDVSTQLFNYPPVGQVSVTSPYNALPADSTSPSSSSADRRERSTEWSMQDAITLNEEWRAWAGLRHTRFDRISSPTEGSTPTRRVQNITTPWFALGYAVAPQTQIYVSWGHGAEVLTAKRSLSVSNSGEVMPAAKSKQFEFGIKQAEQSQQWGANFFHIERPELNIVANRFALDGHATHQGLEGYWQWTGGALGMQASAMLIHARRQGSAVTSINGLAPTNVPKHTLKWSGSYKLPAAWTGAWPTTTFMDIVHEGPRWADKANTLRVSAWTRIDANVQTVQKLSDQAITWRLGVTNLLNTRAWRESPNSFDHIWLFPMAARTWTASAQINF